MTLTLMLYLFLFEDNNHPRPVQNRENIESFITPIMLDVIRLHYYETLKPPKKWNYDYELKTVSRSAFDNREYMRDLNFLNPETKKIDDDIKYRKWCNEFKSLWKDELIERFPKYSREKLEDGFEEINFDYFSERSLFVASILLVGVMKNDVSEYRSVN